MVRDNMLWEYKAVHHEYFPTEEIHIQINVPLDIETSEFEVVCFNNGTVVNRAVFNDMIDTFESAIEIMMDNFND